VHTVQPRRDHPRRGRRDEGRARSTSWYSTYERWAALQRLGGRLSHKKDATTGVGQNQAGGQVAEIFQRSPQTVRDWINARRLRAYKLNGREYRITRAAVEEYLEQQRNGEPNGQTDGRSSSADLGA
jgi:excisionase family DNA binding protein